MLKIVKNKGFQVIDDSETKPEIKRCIMIHIYSFCSVFGLIILEDMHIFHIKGDIHGFVLNSNPIQSEK